MRRPGRELPVCVPDFADCVLPDGLGRRESEWAAPEWALPAWSAPDCAVLEWLADESPCED
ncbi:MAG TPA: hypothetical protein VFX20_01785 [Steroidobacteraceae bacterium]|nr:hypothetical protein [Steroidobacteraceae bacterium]